MRSLLLLLTLTTLLLPPSQAATVSFTASGPVSAISGSTAVVSATVTISTFTDLVRVQIFNNIVGASRDLQGISGIDFALSNGYTAGTLSSRTGLVRTIASDGSFVNGDTTGNRPADFGNASYNNDWTVLTSANQTNGITNGMSLTTLNGGSPSLTIFGASNGTSATCCYINSLYGGPNRAISNFNPYLATQSAPITFNILLTGVTVDTQVLPNTGNVRFFFGTDRTAYLNGVVVTPEADSLAMMGIGLVTMSLLGRWRPKA